jgi:sarcosine oxidase
VTGDRFDVVVVGCGAAGAATAWWCARRGMSVLAVDRFEPGHRRGSSHGTERIVRLGHTDPAYVRFALDALDRWRELERAAGVDLLSSTGAIDLGLVAELDEIQACTEARGVPMERLSSAEASRRYPGMHFAGDVLFHADGGVVHADRATSVMRRLAAQSGAQLRPVTEVTRVDQADSGVVVHLGDDCVQAGVAVVTTGAWAPSLLRDVVDLPGYRVTKEQLAFFRPREQFAWPTFIDRAELRHYGMTTPEGLVKVGEHHTGPEVDPDDRTYDVEPTTWRRLIDWVAEHLPGVDPTPVDASTCLYASTPAEDFVLDRVGDIVVGVGLSGHGFKFVPEIGRRLADLTDGTGWIDNPFALHAAPHHVGASGHK